MNTLSPQIRDEQPSDRAKIYSVNELAFDEKTEAELVDALRAAGDFTLSLVAEIDGEIVGHVLFSPVYDRDGHRVPGGLALGPLAVLPGRQRRGVGSALVSEGLRRAKAAGYRFCMLLGSNKYYPRFGFEPGLPRDIRSQFDELNKDLQVIELAPPGLAGVSGLLRFAPAFDELS